jgi:hypothetical protein
MPVVQILFDIIMYRPIARQRRGKHPFATIDEAIFSMGPPRDYVSSPVVSTRLEAGSNTSTVTLRVVGGYEKGSLKSETVRYGHESQGTLTRERIRWRGPAAYAKDRPLLSSERTPQKNKTVTVKV